ncbi:MAG: DUF1499 domain-containing protein [Bdellovibrionales bacterium]
MSLIWALLLPINDITTTPDQAPAFIEIAKLDAHKNQDLAYDPKLKARQNKLYPDLKPLPSSLSAAKIFDQIVKLAKTQEGWKIIQADESNFRLEAVATTSTLKFSDDIVIEVRPEGSRSTVHMRSKSRLGRSDLGANHQRIAKFLSLLSH